MNQNKTKGLFFNKCGILDVDNLPFNTWNQNMIILGIPFGTDDFIAKYWREKYLIFDREVSYFQSYKYLTLEARATISKSKLMPKLSYFGSVLPVPKDIQLRIDRRLLKFVVPHGKTFLTVNN